MQHKEKSSGEFLSERCCLAAVEVIAPGNVFCFAHSAVTFLNKQIQEAGTAPSPSLPSRGSARLGCSPEALRSGGSTFQRKALTFLCLEQGSSHEAQ